MNFAFQNICHPATLHLLRLRSKAKLARVAAAFKNPRRQLITIVAVVLGCVWLSQAFVSVMLRQAADPAKLMTWLPLGLFAYSLWHIVKIVTRTPVEPFEWTPAEQEFVCSAPISRTQLISYRMASIISSAFLKAFCFSILMIPDLNIWAAGLLGMFLGLILVDLFRVGFELLFHGLSKRGQLTSRIVVLGTLVGCAGWTMFHCLTSPQSASDIASPGSLIFFQSFVGELVGLMATPIGYALQMPFVPFCEIIMADQLSMRSLGFVGLSIVMVLSGASVVYRLDRWMNARTTVKESQAFKRGLAVRNYSAIASTTSKQNVTVPWRLGGVGSIVWRQLLGAYNYRMTLAISLGIPTLLCCIPLLANHEPFFMLLNIVGGVVFYSFLLLPSALMLDFRRDVNRIVVLKSLPIGPVEMTLGQLAAPIIICSLFQWGVLTIAVLSGSVIAWQALVAAVLLLPVNTLIFAIENFIFLLSPYRRNQEGLDVFLRTILTFTGKGILFAIGLAATLGWAFASKSITGQLGLSPGWAAIVFGVGGWFLMQAVATAFVCGVCRLYDRFDPSQDAPGES